MSHASPLAEPTRLVTRGFVALSVATLAFFIAAGIVLPAAPTFAKEALGADETGVGIAIASFSIASLILRPLVGWSSDRFGRGPLLIGGALINDRLASWTWSSPWLAHVWARLRRRLAPARFRG